MKLSFDYDSTLSRKDVQEFVKTLILNGHEVWITTSRSPTTEENVKKWPHLDGNNSVVYIDAALVGIPKTRITFTSGINKIEILRNKGFKFHLDDDEVEMISIQEDEDDCIPVWVELPNWKERCLNIITHESINKGKDFKDYRDASLKG